jgi:protein SCO1/2
VDISHSGKFVIVDPQGGIRGYYDTDPEGLDEVYHRSRHVLNESR